MAIQIVRPEPVSTERIRRRLRPVSQERPRNAVVSAIREVVRHAATVENAKDVVKAMNAAWLDVPASARSATDLMLTILELSDSVEEALAIFSRLVVHYPTASKTLDAAREHISSCYPGSEFRLEFGEEDVRLGMSFLYVLVPADDYPSFKQIYDRLGDWWIETFPEANGIIVIFPQRKSANV